VAFSIENPTLGTKRLAARLRAQPTGPMDVSHGTVANILRKAGLNT
jgi:hypothetical protein